MTQEHITVNLKDRNYNIYIKKNILSNCSKYLKNLKLGKKILIVTQEKVPTRFAKLLKIDFFKNGYKVFILRMPSGEQYKDLTSLLKITRFAIQNNFERNDSFCALGGGVISDLTGFAASIYYRGINFISIPTTLLGMVDASIGGKTAINIPEGKNLLGTFYQPRIIFIDPYCLKTLPQREFLVGMGEVIKYALIEKTALTEFEKYKKITFFEYLKKNKKCILRPNQKSIFEILFHAAKIKATVVSKDEKESNLRAILNFGHTFAHGIEQAYNYKKYTHGEAVSIGICLAYKLSMSKGLISKTLCNKVIELISSYKLPTNINEKKKISIIIKAMLHDKKMKDGQLRFILPENVIGKVKIVNDISINDINKLLHENAINNI